MQRITLGVLALAAGLFAQGFVPASANPMPLAKGGIAAKQDGVTQIRRDGHRMGGGNFSRHSFSGNRFIGGNHIGRRHFGGHRFHRRHFYFGPSYYYRPSYYRYDNGCYWLKRKALYTGSRYWWRRYWNCRNGW